MRLSLLACAALALSLLCALGSAQTPTPYRYDTRYFTVPVDHFNWANSGETFQLRYLINTEWASPDGPIFFYTGNEGPIDLFADNTGFMWDIAPDFNATLVFAEHRYYGESLPFGAQSFTPANYAHLSAEQALADYAQLIESLKLNMSMPNAPVISFGGSYGGMLAAWFRLKYPHVTAGAIAASAPVLWFNTPQHQFDPTIYNRIASDDFRAVSQNCFDNIAASWDAIYNAAAAPGGLQAISQQLGLCAPLTAIEDVQEVVWPWLSNVYSTLPMGDYPYPAEFLGPLPAFPVNATCEFWHAANMPQDMLIEASRRTANLFYNYTGLAGPCFNLTGSPSVGLVGTDVWDQQSCTEMIMPIGQYGPPADLFYPDPWNYTEVVANCQANYGVTPRPFWILQQFGGALDWKGATNIVFSNGNLDPWRGGGVLSDLSPTVVAIPVEGGAHHLDLRTRTVYDPPGVTRAREQEVEWIRRFIANPNPSSQVVDKCDDSGLSKKWLIIISVVATFVGTVLLMALISYCRKSKSGMSVTSHEPGSGPYRSI